jgi:hypothetical protein
MKICRAPRFSLTPQGQGYQVTQVPKSGLEAPEFIQFEQAPTTLSAELYTAFERQVSSESQTSTATPDTGGFASTTFDDLPPFTRKFSPDIPFIRQFSPQLPFTRQFSPQSSTAGSLASTTKKPLENLTSGHTKVLIHAFPKSCSREAFVGELKDAGFRTNRDFDDLNFPEKGAVQDYCTMNFKDVSTTRAFMCSFDGRKLRCTSGKAVSVRPFSTCDCHDDFDDLELDEELNFVSTGLVRGFSV